MNIKTKYDIGDEVYYIGGGEIKKMIIDKSYINVSSEEIVIFYHDSENNIIKEPDAYSKAKDILKDIEKKIKDLDKV